MLNKFIEGLIYGAGFAISFIALSILSAYAVMPYVIEKQMQVLHNSVIIDTARTDSDRRSFRNKPTQLKIKESTVIVLIQFKLTDDGRLLGIITKILKKNPEVEFLYSVGDEYPSSSFYPTPDVSYGNGSIVFFTGNPATKQLSAYYFGDHIPMLNDMSLPAFIKMVNDEKA